MAMPKIKTLVSIVEANAEIARLNDALSKEQEAHEATKSAHATEVETHKTALAQKDTKITELETANGTLKADVQAKDKEIGELKAGKQSTAQAAAAIAASTGQTTPVEGKADETKTKEQLWAEYNALGLEERNAFYKKHKATLTA